MKTSTYGIKKQSTSNGVVDTAAESIRLVGYAIVEGGYTDDELSLFSSQFDAAYSRMCDRHGGKDRLEEIDEHNTIRALLALDELFLKLATNAYVLELCDRLLGDYFILNQQNGIINPSHGSPYNQGAYHRDLPYQHFVSSRPLAINALFCLDAFTLENGATKVLPGSHKQEEFPSDALVASLECQITAPRGAFIVLDGMSFHSGGINITNQKRRAINHVYTLPFIRQQIDLLAILGDRYSGDPAVNRLLGYGIQTPRTVDEYYSERRNKKRSH